MAKYNFIDDLPEKIIYNNKTSFITSKPQILLTGVGSYLPINKPNNDLAELNTSDEWITKNGIKFRHLVKDNELTSDMGTKAAKLAILNSCLKPHDIDLIIVATTTSDNTFPSTASKFKNLGCKAVSFDIQAVCAGLFMQLLVLQCLKMVMEINA